MQSKTKKKKARSGAKVQDLKPKKDAKGGVLVSSYGPTKIQTKIRFGPSRQH